MLLIILAYLGGVLTILSPCILPVLPFVFARADQPFVKSGLPLLVGMALTFAAVATLAAVGGGWVVAANEYGRWLALFLLAFFGLTLLSRTLADRLTRPLVALGSRLTQSASAPAADCTGRQGGKPGSALLLGVATGLLWAPCAGPILGLILTGAALQGANATSSLLLLAYAAGAATSIGAVLLLGGKVFKLLKRSLGAGEWVRRGLGAAMLAGVVAIGLGWDTGVLSQVSLASTGSLEQKLVDQFGVSQRKGSPLATQVAGRGANGSDGALSHTLENLPVEGIAPELKGATEWLNSDPLTLESLRGKVVLVDFWTYSCINCLRTLPYVKAWEEKYRNQGLVVIGVHSPEFAFERKVANVVKAKKGLGIRYPVAIDNDFAIWRAYKNQYWPAHYFVDAKGQIRYHHFGEGDWEQSERVIQQLLKEAGQAQVASDLIHVNATGVEQGAALSAARSPETYLGYERGANFASATNAVPDAPAVYAIPENLALNTWGLQGQWQIGGEHSTLQSEHGRIRYHFQGRDVHLVLAPNADDSPVRYRVLLDGKAPGSASGVDVAADGTGTVTEQRLYQLIRLPGEGQEQEHELTIEFLDPGVSAYAFTFG